MNRSLAPAVVALLSLTAYSADAAGQSCNLPNSFKQSDPRGTRTVLYDSSVLVFSTRMHVDADGGAHAYSAKDPAGDLCNPKTHKENVGKDPASLGCAMDSICDGANITVPGGNTLDVNQCPRLIKAFNLIRDSGWKPPAGYQIEPVGIEMKTGNTPCLDANDAYIVSTSSTPSGEGGGACEQKKWLDTMVPSIVVPKCWSTAYRAKNPKECKNHPTADVEVGELVALRGRSSSKVSYGVIGDLGPNQKLGEASVGILMQAAGQTEPPTYLDATDALDQLEQFDVVVFKGTTYGNPLTIANVKDMASVAQAAYTKWGGDLAGAEKMLEACGKAVAR